MAEFEQISTKKIISVLRERPHNKFFWEKEKLVRKDKLARDKDIDKDDIRIIDYGDSTGG